MLSMDSIKHVVGWNRMPFFKKKKKVLQKFVNWFSNNNFRLWELIKSVISTPVITVATITAGAKRFSGGREDFTKNKILELTLEQRD